MRRPLGHIDYETLESTGFGWSSDKEVARKPYRDKYEVLDLKDEHSGSPYESPDIAQLAGIYLVEPPGQVVGYADVVGVRGQILERDMDGEERGCKEQSQEQRVRHDV